MSCLQVLPGVTKLDMPVLVDRAIVEAFVMAGRVALTKVPPAPLALAIAGTFTRTQRGNC